MADTNPTPDSQTTAINLSHDVTHNGHKYSKGTGVKVPKNAADDILRIAHDHQEYLNTLHTKRTYESNAGSISVGGGE